MKVVALCAVAALLAGCVSRTGPADETSTTTEASVEVALDAETQLIVGRTLVNVYIDAGTATVEFTPYSGPLVRVTLDEPGSAEDWTDGETGQSIHVTLVGIAETEAVIEFESA